LQFQRVAAVQIGQNSEACPRIGFQLAGKFLHLGGDQNDLGASRPDFRLDPGKGIGTDPAIGTPMSPMERHDDWPPPQKLRQANETTGLIRQYE
jgi:hypothetical protein